MNIKDFEKNIQAADKECGEQGFANIAALSKLFTSPAWAQLTQDDSKLVKVLLSDAFKNKEKGQAPDQIDTTYLMCYGVLYCAGSPKEKAEVLYGILQDGGLSAHTFISATDKDLPDAFQKMCLLCTVHLFEWAEEFTGFEGPFKDNYDALRAVHEDLREDKFLDDIYGTEGKLNNDEWMKNICDKAKYIFSAKELRKLVFKEAQVEYKM